jgi:hypothetical protein
MRSQPGMAVVCGLAFMLHGNARAAGGDACTYLTGLQISTALGVAIDAGQHIGPGGALCKTPILGIPKTPVRGVGDEAYFIDTPGFGMGLNVKKGSSAFQVKVYGFSPEQIKSFEMTLAQDVLSKL